MSEFTTEVQSDGQPIANLPGLKEQGHLITCGLTIPGNFNFDGF